MINVIVFNWVNSYLNVINKTEAMRQILMPIDFSENAKNAIGYALELFKYERSVFYFLHTYQDEIYENESLTRENLKAIEKEVQQNVESKLAKTLAFINKISPNPRHEYHVVAAALK